MIPPEPRANPDLAGHDHAAGLLAAAAGSGRLHHAWLLAGPPGIGKATLAFRFARWLLAGRPSAPAGAAPSAAPLAVPLAAPPEHPACRLVAAGTHPDLLVLEPNTGDRGKRSLIRADDVRQVPRFLGLTASEGGERVVVVDQAEAMEAPAANALLKALEEPPPRAVLLLVTAAPGRLLPTLRSRCRRLDLSPLAPPVLEALLARWLPGEGAAARADLARLADGSPGAALHLAAGQGVEMQALVAEALAALPRPDPRRWHALAERLGGRGEGPDLATFLALLRRALSEAVRRGGRGAAGAPAWLATRPLAEWATLWDKLGRLGEEAERLSLDRRQVAATGLAWLAAPAGTRPWEAPPWNTP